MSRFSRKQPAAKPATMRRCMKMVKTIIGVTASTNTSIMMGRSFGTIKPVF